MKYTLLVVAAIALISTHFPACAVTPKTLAPAPESPTHRGDGRRIEKNKEPESPTHRGDGRREAKVSGKDFCDEKCGGPDAPQGTGTRYGVVSK